jgi:hypothetical protein
MLFGGDFFPGEIPEKLVTAVALNEDHFILEGEKLVVVRIGRTDTDETDCPLGACYRVGSRGRCGLWQHTSISRGVVIQ